MAEEYLTQNPSLTIDRIIGELAPDRVLVLTDQNVENIVLPLLNDSKVIRESPRVSIPAGETAKNLDTVTKVWDKLEEIQATRGSLVLNIGGGVVTDLGGFAAATFKRGISTVNFPTTLLGAVDAATGGKTGINFHGLKNEIGTFHLPSKVILSTLPFSTLPKKEILSGYAEMIKTAIVSDRDFYISLLDMEEILGDDLKLGLAVEKCVQIKEEVVKQDPDEKGLRKILNFGHTAGHAFESIGMKRKLGICHGKAVAHGILVALILSHLLLGFDSSEVNHYRKFLKSHYGPAPVNCRDADLVIKLMDRDKKNRVYGSPLFTLLKSVGNPEINVSPSPENIREALEIYQDMME